MDRYLKKAALEDLKRKMVFIGGPRQVGKTTLSLDLAPKKHRYFNWDALEDREFILRQHIPPDRFIIFDEIHKLKDWRNYVKGLYDKHKNEKKYLSLEAQGWIITDTLEILCKDDTITIDSTPSQLKSLAFKQKKT